MKLIISALVEDRPGVLNRVASMFRRRGFNIASLTVGHSEQSGFSRMTIVVDNVPATAVDQVTKQLYNVIEVVKATDITHSNIVAKETALVKVGASATGRAEIIQIANLVKAEIADVSPGSMILELTSSEEEIDRLLELLRPFGVREVMRSGKVAMVRGG